jgi:hypothetical protein
MEQQLQCIFVANGHIHVTAQADTTDSENDDVNADDAAEVETLWATHLGLSKGKG